MPGLVGEPTDVTALIAAVTSAYRQASEAIGGLDDHEVAHAAATALGTQIRVAMDTNADQRALLTFIVQAETGLSVRELAKRLRMKKSRADQLLARARELRATHDGDSA